MTGTGNALATRNGGITAHQQAALAIQPGQVQWTPMQDAALTQLGIKDASDGDKAVFLHQCQRTGLDPFARQIYMIARREPVPGTRDQWRTKWTIQTGIDGFRVNRARAERDAGVRGTLGRAVFYDYDGREHKVWVQQRPPAACEITYIVRDKDGGEVPYTSVLRYSEYVQTKDGNPIAQWATKPVHMLEKCTEADVYRKAFPQDFSGVHLDDAMPPPEEQEAPPLAAPRATAADIRAQAAARNAVPAEVVQPAAPERLSEIKAHLERLGVPVPRRPALITGMAGRDVAHPGELTAGEAAHVIRTLEGMPTPEKAAEPEPPRGDPRNGVLNQFARLGITSLPGQMRYAARLLGIDQPSDVNGLTGEQAAALVEVLAGCGSPDELEAEAVAREAARDE